MSIYLTKPEAEPKTVVEAGTLRHLVAGNRGCLKDARQTPVRITDVLPAKGSFVLEIEDFEDKGAQWEVPIENVRHCGFHPDSRTASAFELAQFQAAVARFDRPLSIACEPENRKATIGQLVLERQATGEWLSRNSRFFSQRGELPPPETREGDPRLAEDLREFMESRSLWEIEDAFARQFVSNPNSGELIKGHRIVLAEMGLIPYEGKVVRDPALFVGRWNKGERSRHILSRLAFVHEFFARLGCARLTLYRGISRNGPLIANQNHTFVSASFSREVAESHFDGRPQATGVLYRQSMSVHRLFMTYLETVQMNRQYKEAEAILLFDKGNLAF